jgi:hypothetical protein
MNTTVVQTTIRRFGVPAGVLVFGLASLSCSRGPSTDRVGAAPEERSSVASAAAQANPDVDLPSKTFREMPNGVIRMDGHWVLKTSDPPVKSRELPFAAQPLNSAIIECTASTRTCQEYRATVIGRMLLPNDPIMYEVMTWDSERLVASWTAPASVECSLRIDWRSKEVEMEYRRQPSANRRSVFERWVLE